MSVVSNVRYHHYRMHRVLWKSWVCDGEYSQ